MVAQLIRLFVSREFEHLLFGVLFATFGAALVVQSWAGVVLSGVGIVLLTIARRWSDPASPRKEPRV